ncbi:hypothetical protein [Parapedobacter pyrenivorans]|uniref:hypothetical protein n=1 Tax=Parapedobacter pyrenivorans TaxID=1305674 RepID=UPI003342B8AB
MKAIRYCIAVCMAFGMAHLSYAQQATVVRQGYNNESDYGKFYLRVGASFLNNDFITQLNDGEIGDGYSAPTGLNFELGRYFFLQSEPVADLFKVGIDATFLSIGYNPLKWNDPDDPSYSEKFDLTTVGVKLGPVISFNPLGDLYVDAFAKVAPTVLTSIAGLEDVESVLFGWKSDFGVNLRYKKVTLTAGYESGSFKYDSYEYDEVTDIESSSKEKFPMGMFQVKLGLQFY